MPFSTGTCDNAKDQACITIMFAHMKFQPNVVFDLPPWPENGSTDVHFSYEDRSFNDVFAGPLVKFLADHANQIVESHFLTVMRDPKNLIAGGFKK